MPLYKITSKRLARKEREDASGLTELKAKILEELGEDDGSSGSSGSGSDEDEDDEEEDESGGSEGSEGTVDSEGECFGGGLGRPGVIYPSSGETYRVASCRVEGCPCRM